MPSRCYFISNVMELKLHFQLYFEIVTDYGAPKVPKKIAWWPICQKWATTSKDFLTTHFYAISSVPLNAGR